VLVTPIQLCMLAARVASGNAGGAAHRARQVGHNVEQRPQLKRLEFSDAAGGWCNPA
jgi:hypothetical protein